MMNWFNKRHIGFTLAEVLITLGVIGVVAAITLPTITTNIHTSMLRKRATTETRKFTQALENMVAFDNIAGKGDTEHFVKTLHSYLKIAKTCDNKPNKIAECWPTDSIKLYDGSTFGIDQAQKGSVFRMNNKDASDNYASFDSDNVAIITQDGTSMLLAYNSSCKKYDKDAAINCVVGLFDVNGAKGPNRLGRDVVLLNASQFGKGFIPNYNDIACKGNSACANVTDLFSVDNMIADNTTNQDGEDSDYTNEEPDTTAEINNYNGLGIGSFDGPESTGGTSAKPGGIIWDDSSP